MKNKHNRPLHFSTIIFLKYFRAILVFVVCFILIFCILIDSIMLANVKQKNISDAESAITQISKNIVLNQSLTELISNDEQLKLMIRTFPNESHPGQAALSRSISDLLKKYCLSAPEISDIALYTTMPCDFDYLSMYYIPNFIGTDWYDCFQINGITLFDKFSLNNVKSGSFLDNEKLSIICPITENNTPYSWYICTSISKDYLCSTYMKLQNPEDEYVVLNNHGEILFSHEIMALNSPFPEESVSDLVFSKKPGNKILKYKNKNYLASCSQTNDYGWKTVSLKPLSNVIVWRGLLIAGTLLSLLLLVLIGYMLSKAFSKNLSAPLFALIKAMKSSSLVDDGNIFIYEIYDLYHGYNNLINENNMLVSKVQLQQKKVTDAEMRALLAQINPHFLYNTLNTISWKALDADRPDICTIISKLGKLYQLNYKFKSTFCTLNDEITSISLYMDLQKECFNSSFDYSVDVPEDCLNLIIPKFIL